jgi:prepilin-type N-terminal cleavage/methylation domain-containing protein
MKHTKHFHPGFTIVELLVVIVVIGVLASITIVAYNGVQQRAQVASTQSKINQYEKQLEIHIATSGVSPNMVFDGGWENDYIWSPKPTGVTLTGDRSTVEKRSGSYSWRVDSTGNVFLHVGSDRVARLWPHDGTKKLYFEGWVFAPISNPSGGVIWVRATINNSDGIQTDTEPLNHTYGDFTGVQIALNSVTKGSWQKITAVMDMPWFPDEGSTSLYLSNSSIPSGAVVYWDDIRVVDITGL